MKKLELTYGNSMKLTKTKQYEMMNPFYCEKICFELEDHDELDAAKEFAALRKIVDEELFTREKRHRESLVKPDMEHLRIRERKGKKYPSVTSIITPDKIKFGGPIPLECYSRRGTEIERLVFHYLKTHEWLKPSASVDIDALKWEDIKYKEFFEKYENEIAMADVTEFSKEVFNSSFAYSGEIDIYNILVRGQPTIADVKCANPKYIKMEQPAAYLNCDGITCDQIAIFDLKTPKLVIEPWMPYYQSFLMMRGAFKQRFSL